MRSWVRIPPRAWIFFCCECRVLSGRGLCDELITRPEESYRLWCVVVYDLETSRIGAPYIYDISSLRVNRTLTTEGDVGFKYRPIDGIYWLKFYLVLLCPSCKALEECSESHHKRFLSHPFQLITIITV